jgi:hypothetical protein
MKLVQYLVNFFEAGEAKFKIGVHYFLNDETQQHVDQGHAVLKEVDMNPEKAQALADKAVASAERAAQSAARATADAADAKAADLLVKEAEAMRAAGGETKDVSEPAVAAASYPGLDAPAATPSPANAEPTEADKPQASE